MKSQRKQSMLSLVAIPALLVAGASLLVLSAGLVGAAQDSRPGDVLYPLQGVALQLQLVLT